MCAAQHFLNGFLRIAPFFPCLACGETSQVSCPTGLFQGTETPQHLVLLVCQSSRSPWSYGVSSSSLFLSPILRLSFLRPLVVQKETGRLYRA